MAEKNEKSSEMSFGAGFKIALIVLVGLPVVGLLGWYFLSAGLSLSGSKMTAEGMVKAGLIKAKGVVVEGLAERAGTEGFDLGDVDSCRSIEDQYRIPQGYVMTDNTRRELVGLGEDATDEETQERCVTFARVVARMEQLAHHDRHVFVCQGAEFTTDKSGSYILMADANGEGAVEVRKGVKSLIPIEQYRHTLINKWQVYNLGDGCIVIGMSKDGVFRFSGSVSLNN